MPQPTMPELESLAASLPSMGGRQIGSFLRPAARDVPPDTNIVELGSWLGSGTAQMALGLLDRPSLDGVSINCFDRWTASNAEVEKAAKCGATLAEGMDTLPWVRERLAQFDVPINYEHGDIEKAEWHRGPISLFVDDATKAGDIAISALQTFGPSWIPGETVIVFMDYWFWKKSGKDKHKFHMRLVEANPEVFQPIKHDFVGSSRAFRYASWFNFERYRNLAKFL